MIEKTIAFFKFILFIIYIPVLFYFIKEFIIFIKHQIKIIKTKIYIIKKNKKNVY